MAFMAGKPDKRPFYQVFLLGVFKITYGLYIRVKCNVKMAKNDAYRTQGPYILLANHVHNLDPIFIQYFWPRIISYVTNDTVWKVKALRGILDAVGFIPKKKMTTDSAAVRGILTNVKKGRIIGIFPEGRRSWDGVTKEIIPSTISLAKKLKLPVITVKISGGMMSRPRWSNTNRRGTIIIKPETTLTVEQVKVMTADEMFETIKTALEHDETEFLQENTKLNYHRKSPAEFLELYLYVCKQCGAMAKMHSHKKNFACTACGANYTFNKDATLTDCVTQQIHTLTEWDIYQQTYVKNAVAKLLVENKINDVLFKDDDVTLYEYVRLEPLKLLTKGKLSMTATQMRFLGENEEQYTYPAKMVTGTNVQKNSQLEFTIDDRTFRFLFNTRVSPLKWQHALKCASEQ